MRYEGHGGKAAAKEDIMARRKILWVSHNVPYPPKSGVLQRNYNLLREASKRGEIYLLAVHQDKILPVPLNMDEARRELGRFCKRIETVRLAIDSSRAVWLWVVLKSVFTRDPFAANWIKSTQLGRKLRRMLSEIDFDLVHFDTISLAVYRDEVHGIPSVLNHHNMESKLMERRGKIEPHPLKKMYYRMEAKKIRRFEATHCRAFDVNFTVSDLDGEWLLEVDPELRIEVIPNGVDMEYFRPSGVPRVPGNIIFIGGMNWYPNRDAVMHLCRDIWPLVKKGFPSATLTIVGADPPQAVTTLASDDPNVTVTGFVDDVRPYYESADIYVCPMRDGGGTRLKILDSLAMKKALVSTTMGCEGVEVTPERNVLLADTPEQFLAQIERILTDSSLRNSLGEEGRRLIEHRYSWHVIGRKLDQVYESLAPTGRRVV
jgi:glycosyltransferase involved in cell wall biosynthesis